MNTVVETKTRNQDRKPSVKLAKWKFWEGDAGLGWWVEIVVVFGLGVGGYAA